MPYSGLLKKVYDNAKHWGLVIDVDEHGERKFNLWNKRYAGIKPDDGSEIECDVHNWEGMRVVFDATKGKPKQDGTDACWPSVVDAIWLEAEEVPHVRDIVAEIEREGSEIEPRPESAQEHVGRNTDELTRLTMEMLNAVGKWTGEVKRLLDKETHDARIT